MVSAMAIEWQQHCRKCTNIAFVLERQSKFPIRTNTSIFFFVNSVITEIYIIAINVSVIKILESKVSTFS